jgi:hypothetical protein
VRFPLLATTELVAGEHHLDAFEKREDRWKILDRVVVLDWFRLYPDSGEWQQKPLGMDVAPGGRLPNDPSHRFFFQ